MRLPAILTVGRRLEIDQLVQSTPLRLAYRSRGISSVRGMGGIGKTEMAYVVADQLKYIYPDAKLVVELRGASSSPLTAKQALQTVIRSFERETKLPEDL